MGGGRSKPGRRERGLSAEDKMLWKQYSNTVTPLRDRRRIGDEPPDSANAQAQDDSRETVRPRRDQPATAARPAGASRPVPGNELDGEIHHRLKADQQLGKFNSKKRRRLGSGRQSIEARIDLHGMRQSEARAQLKRFLFGGFAKGYRTVLVITGKGGTERSDRPWDGGERADRGVLKRMVPLWLQEPDLSAIVVSYTPAHVRHGGAGALYVQIRRAGRV